MNQFPPLDDTTKAEHWRKAGICRLFDLWDRNQIQEKISLSKKLNTEISWFKYLQIQHLLSSKDIKQGRECPKTSFEILLLTKLQHSRGLLSKINKLLTVVNPEFQHHYQQQWNSDCKLPLDNSQWQGIWSSFPFRSSTISIQWQTIKLLTRWYCTLERLNRISSQNNPKCRKGCGNIANFLHCWWTCPLIKKFWSNIITEINLIVDKEILVTVKYILLNLWEKPCKIHRQRSLS